MKPIKKEKVVTVVDRPWTGWYRDPLCLRPVITVSPLRSRFIGTHVVVVVVGGWSTGYLVIYEPVDTVLQPRYLDDRSVTKVVLPYY